MRLERLAKEVLEQAEACGLTIAAAESCTAGRLARLLSDAPGAAHQFHGGVVAYTKPMKAAALGVCPTLLAEQGAVCEDTAKAMANGVLERTPAELAVSITGVAGPNPDEDGNPVGLVYCAIARRGEAAKAFRFLWDHCTKDEVLENALGEALRLLKDHCGARCRSNGRATTSASA